MRIAAQQRVTRDRPMRRYSPVVTPAAVAHPKQALLEWPLALTLGVRVDGVWWQDARFGRFWSEVRLTQLFWQQACSRGDSDVA